MIEKTVVVGLAEGLHARPASLFVKTANSFSSHIRVCRDHHGVDAKSILGLMSMAIAKGQEITLMADGIDEKEAIEKLTNFLTGSEE